MTSSEGAERAEDPKGSGDQGDQVDATPAPVEEVLPDGMGPNEADLHPGADGHVGSQPGAVDSADEVDQRFDAG